MLTAAHTQAIVTGSSDPKPVLALLAGDRPAVEGALREAGWLPVRVTPFCFEVFEHRTHGMRIHLKPPAVDDFEAILDLAFFRIGDHLMRCARLAPRHLTTRAPRQ